MRRVDEDWPFLVTIYVMLIATMLSGAINWLGQLGYL
jgi:hypothetical protein